MKKDTLKYSDHVKHMVKVAGASKSLKQEMLGMSETKKRTSITLDTSKGPITLDFSKFKGKVDLDKKLNELYLSGKFDELCEWFGCDCEGC